MQGQIFCATLRKDDGLEAEIHAEEYRALLGEAGVGHLLLCFAASGPFWAI